MNQQKRIRFIVLAATLSAVAIIINYIDFPIIPWAGYLKIDASEALVLIALSFSIPLAIVVAIVKMLFMSIWTTTNYLGELILLLGSFIVIFSYYFSRKKFSIITSLIFTTILFTFIMTIANYYIITPLYYPGTDFETLKLSSQTISIGDKYSFETSYLSYILLTYIPFNLVKGLFFSVVYYFTNKRLHLEEK